MRHTRVADYPSEHLEQVALFEWIALQTGRWPELALTFAVPNGAMMGGGKIGAIRARGLMAEGMRPGVPDIFIPCPRHGCNGAFIEMKSRNGKLRANQQEYLEQAERYGYATCVAYGADDAIAFLERYMDATK